MKPLLFVPLIAMLTACGPASRVASTPSKVPTSRVATVPATRPAPPATGGFRTARVMNATGLEGVIGVDTAALQRQFGKPRLDVWEGDARKLQFSGEACVLDIYLYPPRPGATPTSSYIDARRASDGLDVDRAACIKALKRPS